MQHDKKKGDILYYFYLGYGSAWLYEVKFIKFTTLKTIQCTFIEEIFSIGWRANIPEVGKKYNFRLTNLYHKEEFYKKICGNRFKLHKMMDIIFIGSGVKREKI